ncbi:MAG: biotin--[acetyl-CoA-carboxylase] ligase [Kangiellaceae bacterium]|nr:biotin--[acetyl-CoA-carboxylase] ligase [Kangiellaceae bacterium]
MQRKLLKVLSDGQFHSGQAMAAKMGVSRAAIWKVIKELRALGLDIFSVTGKGYKLAETIDLIDPEQLARQLLGVIKTSDNLFLFTSLASTNKFLLSLPQTNDVRVCISEFQSEGRGRLGRVWHSPFAKNIYCSIRLVIPRAIEQISGLSLVVGYSVAEILTQFGVQNLKLKWPNDIRLNSAKVGGVLIELGQNTETSVDVVIGIGLNWDMPNSDQLKNRWTNLKPHLLGNPTREALISALVARVVDDVEVFTEHGFSVFNAGWSSYDEFYQQPVTLQSASKTEQGIARGVDDRGALLLEQDGQVNDFSIGELSLKVNR